MRLYLFKKRAAAAARIGEGLLTEGPGNFHSKQQEKHSATLFVNRAEKFR